MTLPNQIENPNGLHQKYVIKKLVKDVYAKGMIMEQEYIREENVDPESEYFVLRLDDKATDKNHLKACRIAINAYAEAIQNHIPKLADDLRNRYPLIIH